MPGAREVLERLKRDARVVYLTNKPLDLPEAYARKLTKLGIPTEPEQVVSSLDALLFYLGERAPGARLFVVGEATLREALGAAGYALTEAPSAVDVVVVSFDRTFDYRKLKIAFDAVRARRPYRRHQP